MIQTVIIGPVTIYIYGLLIGLAIGLGWEIAERMWVKQGFKATHFDTLAVIMILSGVMGARLYHVVDYWSYYRLHWLQIGALWQGGLGIWGALGGGAVGLIVGIKRIQGSLLGALDSLAVALPLAQAVGRLGNWVNYELFGKQTDLPWGIFIPRAYRPETLLEVSTFHPLFAYEALALCLLFGGLIFYAQNRLGSGKVWYLYLIGYGLIRAGLEPLRINPWTLVGWPVAQIIAGLVVVIGMVGWIRVGLRHEV